MSIFNIPKKEIESILPLLQEGAKNRLGTEGICTLAELDPDESFAGCIQFAVEEENDTPVGRLLYLYVLPQKREQGVGEQLLMAMEDSLFKHGIRRAVVLLPSEQSELGEYLEEYGFSMTENRRACFVRLSSIRSEKEIDEELSSRIVSLQELGGTGARRIYSLYKDITTWNTEGLDLTQSCALAETEPEAMLLVRNENGYPALTFFAPNNEDGWESKRALILWMAEHMKETYPIATRLLLSDPRDASWYCIEAGNVSDVCEAVVGTLEVEEPERMPEGEAAQ